MSPVSSASSGGRTRVSVAARRGRSPSSTWHGADVVLAIYCASKSAIIGLTRCDAIDYSPHLIRVIAVCPGIIETPMTMAQGEGPSMSLPIEVAPMARLGTPDEVADVCLFLCSENASFVQGAAWAVDGGYSIN